MCIYNDCNLNNIKKNRKKLLYSKLTKCKHCCNAATIYKIDNGRLYCIECGTWVKYDDLAEEEKIKLKEDLIKEEIKIEEEREFEEEMEM